jgi:hypothetical protein
VGYFPCRKQNKYVSLSCVVNVCGEKQISPNQTQVIKRFYD